MSKRRAADELYGDSAKRADQFTAHLRALNSQFAQWAQQQAAQAGDQLWLSGVKDYIKHADRLLEQYDDVLVNGNQHRSSPPLASNLFGTPAPAANGPAAAAAAADEAAGAATGRSTGFGGGGGRKSVTFAEQPNFGAAGGSAAAATPGFGTPAAGAAATPGTANTANAGHTPAPASGMNFSFGATPAATPAAKGGELPSPEPFKLGGSATPGGAGGGDGISAGPSPSSGGFSFGATPTPAAAGGSSGGGFGFTPAGAAAAAAAGSTPSPAPSGGSGFTFGASSSSTPAGQDSAAAAGGASSNGAGFSFGATPAAAAAAGGSSTGGFSFGASPAAAAADGSSGSGPAATTFSFGAMPSSSSAAAAGGAGGSSAPAFGFATTAAAGSGTAGGGLFNFPAPSAAAAGDAAAGAAAADGDADEEAPAKFTPELKVNEDVWNVLFNNKAKLFIRVKKDSGATDWENRGVGLLTVRQAKQGDNSGKTYIYFSTDVGKQLVQSQLIAKSAVLPVPNQPNRCRIGLFVTKYNMPPAGAQADSAAATTGNNMELQACMLTLGSAAKVEELAQLVEKHKPKK